MYLTVDAPKLEHENIILQHLRPTRLKVLHNLIVSRPDFHEFNTYGKRAQGAAAYLIEFNTSIIQSTS